MANTIIHPTRSEGAVVCSWLLRAGDDERWVEWKRTVLLLETKILRQPVPIERP